VELSGGLVPNLRTRWRGGASPIRTGRKVSALGCVNPGPNGRAQHFYSSYKSGFDFRSFSSRVVAQRVLH